MSRTVYRPEIDGLRAIAVMAVIAFHADFSVIGWHPARGGFLGVDVFFVISGYLITGIILAELGAGAFSFARFYERRARRILPALIVVIVSCIPLAWSWMTPEQLDNFSKSGLATIAFASNFFFLFDANYFSASIHLKPLSHTWSLAVEEQFYLLFPFFLATLSKTRANTYLVLGCLIVASFVLAQAMSTRFPDANFYLFPTRLWELLAGALLAKLEQKFGRSKSLVLGGAMPALGLACLFIAFMWFDGKTTHPGFPTVLPIAATMVLIWFTGGRDIVTSLLSFRTLVGIGLISYSLYLIHQPLFAFVRIYAINQVSQLTYFALACAAAGLAYLSWRFVEQPFRQSTIIPRRVVWIGAFFGTASLALAGVTGHLSGGFPSRMPDLPAVDRVAAGYKTLSNELCTRDNCVVGDPGVQPTIVLIGDSHAGMLAQSLEKALKNSGKAAHVLANGDMFVDRYPPFYDTGDRYNPVLEAQKKIVYAHEIKTVILAARYTLRVENTPFNNGEGGVESLPITYNGRTLEEKRKILGAIEYATRDLVARDKHLVIVYPIPEVGWDVPTTLRKLSMRHQRDLLTTSYEVYIERNKLVNSLFDSILEVPNVIKVRPDRILCDTFVRGRCATHTDTAVFYFDDDHLSVIGSDLIIANILQKTKEKWGSLD